MVEDLVGVWLDLFGLGFGWICFELCFWLQRMWWLYGGGYWLLVEGY